MPRKSESEQEPHEGEVEVVVPAQKRERRPSAARQMLIEAAEGKEQVLTFETPEKAKSAAYLWWGHRRRADLTEKVVVTLDTKAMTVSIGPRAHDDTPTSTEPDASVEAEPTDEGHSDEEAMHNAY